MLAEAEGHREQSHQHAGDRPGQHRRGDPQPQAAGEVGRGKPGHRREQHDPLDAEIENPGPFGEQLTEGGEQQRRRDADHRREETDLEDLGEDFIHGSGVRREFGSW